MVSDRFVVSVIYMSFNPMAKISRITYLQNLADSLRTADQYEFYIEFRPFHGWFAVSCDLRWHGDNGEYLGACWQEADKAIRLLLG